MQSRRILPILSLLLVFAMFLAACPAPAPAAPAAEAPAAAVEAPAAVEAAPTEAPMAEAPAASDEVVTIEYWQYNFAARVTAMDELIAQFEADNPNIKVIHNSDIPYDQFRDKIAASVPAGVGPDVATLFYGWQSVWIDAGYLVPLPEDAFPHDMVRSEFSPMVEASFVGDELYTLPTAVRTLALLLQQGSDGRRRSGPGKPAHDPGRAGATGRAVHRHGRRWHLRDHGLPRGHERPGSPLVPRSAAAPIRPGSSER